jgi:uncharacterized protein YecE (DUF72 family)
MLYVGCAGWTIPRRFSAEFPGTGSHLERYSRVLPCAEINSSFYRPHRRSTWERWAESVPVSFRFSVKAPKLITHEAGLECAPTELDDFLDQVLLLGERLGPILFQTPPKLQFRHDVAHRFFSMLRNRFNGPVAFEPRHAAWFTPEAGHLLSEFAIARVAADPVDTPEAKLPGGSHTLAYYRLHGSPRRYYSEYSDDMLSQIATSLRSVPERTDAWCIFDNTASGAAAGDALRLLQLLNEPRVHIDGESS